MNHPEGDTALYSNFCDIFCSNIIFTARKRSLGRLCLYTCLSVILSTGGVCLSACWDTPPPEETHPPRTRHPDQTPPRSRHHPDEAPPPKSRPSRPGTPPGADPPSLRSACWEIRSTSGQYASYWNAILLELRSLHFKVRKNW